MKSAFTMIELVFVIVVIGILASIAIPKFAATRDDAEITKAIATIGAVKSSLATERQKRIIRGDFNTSFTFNEDGYAFRYYDGNASTPVLETPIVSCTKVGCWERISDTQVNYRMPPDGTSITFTFLKGRFDCDPEDSSTGEDCKTLTQ